MNEIGGRWVGRLRDAAIALTLTLGLVGCSVIPFPTLVDLSEEQVNELANQQAPQLTQEFGGEIGASDVKAYVQARGLELAAVSERPELPWSFKVLNNDAVNAFALPGGHVFITRGLLVQLENEAELMGVLGHEIGHVTLDHGEKRMEKAATAQLGVQAVATILAGTQDDDTVTLLGAYGAQLGLQMVQLQHSRQDESDADAKGAFYSAELGYSPAGIIGVLEVLASLSQGGTPEILKTHPNPEKRIQDVLVLLDANYPDWEAAQGPYHRFDPDRYRRNVLQPLAAMPAAPDVALVIPDGHLGLFAPIPGREGACGCGH
ncbi:MAG: M48 family metalloprotease [Planctomycetota bacterium]